MPQASSHGAYMANNNHNGAEYSSYEPADFMGHQQRQAQGSHQQQQQRRQQEGQPRPRPTFDPKAMPAVKRLLQW